MYLKRISDQEPMKIQLSNFVWKQTNHSPRHIRRNFCHAVEHAPVRSCLVELWERFSDFSFKLQESWQNSFFFVKMNVLSIFLSNYFDDLRFSSQSISSIQISRHFSGSFLSVLNAFCLGERRPHGRCRGMLIVGAAREERRAYSRQQPHCI